jgi:hypothetical protein
MSLLKEKLPRVLLHWGYEVPNKPTYRVVLVDGTQRQGGWSLEPDTNTDQTWIVEVSSEDAMGELSWSALPEEDRLEAIIALAKTLADKKLKLED